MVKRKRKGKAKDDGVNIGSVLKALYVKVAQQEARIMALEGKGKRKKSRRKRKSSYY